MGVVNYPSMASALAKELALADDNLPPYISISPSRGPGQGGFGPGFFGPKSAPLMVAGDQSSLPAAAAADGAAKRRSRTESRRDQAAPRRHHAKYERRLEL